MLTASKRYDISTLANMPRVDARPRTPVEVQKKIGAGLFASSLAASSLVRRPTETVGKVAPFPLLRPEHVETATVNNIKSAATYDNKTQQLRWRNKEIQNMALTLSRSGRQDEYDDSSNDG